MPWSYGSMAGDIAPPPGGWLQQCCYISAVTSPGPEVLGTRLRHLLELLEGDVAQVYADLGLAGFRSRYTPIVRILATAGPSAIRDLALAIGVTHSAASQTVT